MLTTSDPLSLKHSWIMVNLWFFGTSSRLRNKENIVVIDLRGQDRDTGTIQGTLAVPAMDFLKNLSQWCERLQSKPIVTFFCQYSAHRAPSVANHYRQSCPAKQRVVIIEGGFRAWEAQRLPVVAGKSSLSPAALDTLALKIGAELVATMPCSGTTQP